MLLAARCELLDVPGRIDVVIIGAAVSERRAGQRNFELRLFALQREIRINVISEGYTRARLTLFLTIRGYVRGRGALG